VRQLLQVAERERVHAARIVENRARETRRNVVEEADDVRAPRFTAVDQDPRMPGAHVVTVLTFPVEVLERRAKTAEYGAEVSSGVPDDANLLGAEHRERERAELRHVVDLARPRAVRSQDVAREVLR